MKRIEWQFYLKHSGSKWKRIWSLMTLCFRIFNLQHLKVNKEIALNVDVMALDQSSKHTSSNRIHNHDIACSAVGHRIARWRQHRIDHTTCRNFQAWISRIGPALSIRYFQYVTRCAELMPFSWWTSVCTDHKWTALFSSFLFDVVVWCGHWVHALL